MNNEYYVGFNSGSLVDMVSEESIKELFDAEEWTGELEEDWLDQGYGFCIPTNFENTNEELLYELDEDLFIVKRVYFNIASDGEIEVNSNHQNVSKILSILKKSNTKYYDQNQKIIQSDELETLIKTKDDYVLFICELETP